MGPGITSNTSVPEFCNCLGSNLANTTVALGYIGPSNSPNSATATDSPTTLGISQTRSCKPTAPTTRKYTNNFSPMRAPRWERTKRPTVMPPYVLIAVLAFEGIEFRLGLWGGLRDGRREEGPGEMGSVPRNLL